ncbi:nitrate reductase molybdenum cofactor assembly chaperone [Oceanisphaera avium]|uniref:Nitrate reductase molybdenum cofactor assembly chaperone n=1 Tax=Oceanisphaera avium TaxID=1903694 RepID=A0A1Y0CVN0_9GAMM|nr:nitrate reductase molybdenum cofactor assembly chaperone [Oceanisphaera avium]ART79383.1 nitrate reductase molybdenum cofactor assembly chaperone [Oceanisphaera avium]
MQILKVISLLLDYPAQVVLEARDELAEAISTTRVISPEQRSALLALLSQVAERDLMDSQEAYVKLFNRGRHLSLLLFEHVHGESRDRGQAMVDLMAQYEKDGFDIGVKELPDYIPLYLEYLSYCDEPTARAGLADVEHLLALLAARLAEQDSAYSACFQALLQIAGFEPTQAINEVKEQVSQEEYDDSLEALDALWEEEAITFMGGNQSASCGSSGGKPVQVTPEAVAVPLHWLDFSRDASASTSSKM